MKNSKKRRPGRPLGSKNKLTKKNKRTANKKFTALYELAIVAGEEADRELEVANVERNTTGGILKMVDKKVLEMLQFVKQNDYRLKEFDRMVLEKFYRMRQQVGVELAIIEDERRERVRRYEEEEKNKDRERIKEACERVMREIDKVRTRSRRSYIKDRKTEKKVCAGKWSTE
jgi:hypothetical protein